MIINGQFLAEKIKREIKKKVVLMKKKPGLAMILVGDDPASKIYLREKEKACKKVGFYSRRINLAVNISQAKLISQIKKLNKNTKIDGILVQLPLPKHIDSQTVIKTIDPQKDVDCFHPQNVGKLALLNKKVDWDQLLVPCTPKGVIKLIQSTGVKIAGKKAVVIGRSNLTGKPTALLLLALGATVTICHSQTKELVQETRQADILVAAAGQAKMIKKNMVKKGAIVVDVGINRIKGKLVGDADFDQVEKVAGFVTPVPGGVGPMTVACLLENNLLLAESAFC
jgi:methylenetetrahydrofolate dehydrogenase (NADP+)/methenyltetrahydrofolate cyclohydrolase